MDASHLDHILDRLPDTSVNVYGKGTQRTVMGSYIQAARELGRPYRVAEDDRGRRYLQLLRHDGSHLGDIEPVLLPGCSTATRAICNNKITTASVLSGRGVRTPFTAIHGPDDVDRAYEDAFRTATQVVIKARSLTLGRGVFLNVTKENFREHFWACVEKQKGSRRPDLLVQEMVPGFEMRATVVEGELDNVLVRIPAYVVGDGRSTIDRLIDAKNERRSRCAYFGTKLIARDHNLRSYMQAYGLDGSQIPKDGERVLLSSISNASYGGETAIVTDLVSDQIKDTAVRAVAAVPGLRTAGVDIMAESFDSASPVVLELNSFPHAHLSIYPYFGAGTNPLTRFLRAFYAEDAKLRGAIDEIPSEDQHFLAAYQRFYDLKHALEAAAVTA
ncbi:hypothetical protein BH708_10585 [Brachybacterium sp. P6-10-X1]|uniref:ATP-grasp domain-containing protein n=1 Tax=Brachybacterium sp. P6-10-X1 TaxID=1903186 RepID=UPI000971AD38|nr:ATP-grasp domain-containing protein [Brachybacterium sp. P6-10-X1]APX33085.1 hypothetical protein BH708_10585 [Brachybacterium sp. P6-10-X1]